MFGSLFRRAQHSIDNAIGNAITRALVAIPFIIAIGFLTVAASLRLTDMYGAEMAYILLAGGYALIGLIGLAVTNLRSGETMDSPVSDSVETEVAANGDDAASEPLSSADQDLLVAALSSAAPIALPSLLRVLYRNLPIVLAVLVAAFLYLRSDEPAAGADTAPVPAE